MSYIDITEAQAVSHKAACRLEHARMRYDWVGFVDDTGQPVPDINLEEERLRSERIFLSFLLEEDDSQSLLRETALLCETKHAVAAVKERNRKRTQEHTTAAKQETDFWVSHSLLPESVITMARKRILEMETSLQNVLSDQKTNAPKNVVLKR